MHGVVIKYVITVVKLIAVWREKWHVGTVPHLVVGNVFYSWSMLRLV